MNACLTQLEADGPLVLKALVNFLMVSTHWGLGTPTYLSHYSMRCLPIDCYTRTSVPRSTSQDWRGHWPVWSRANQENTRFCPPSSRGNVILGSGFSPVPMSALPRPSCSQRVPLLLLFSRKRDLSPYVFESKQAAQGCGAGGSLGLIVNKLWIHHSIGRRLSLTAMGKGCRKISSRA